MPWDGPEGIRRQLGGIQEAFGGVREAFGGIWGAFGSFWGIKKPPRAFQGGQQQPQALNIVLPHQGLSARVDNTTRTSRTTTETTTTGAEAGIFLTTVEPLVACGEPCILLCRSQTPCRNSVPTHALGSPSQILGSETSGGLAMNSVRCSGNTCSFPLFCSVFSF